MKAEVLVRYTAQGSVTSALFFLFPLNVNIYFNKQFKLAESSNHQKFQINLYRSRQRSWQSSNYCHLGFVQSKAKVLAIYSAEDSVTLAWFFFFPLT